MKEAMKQIIAEIDALPEGLEGYFSDTFADNLAKVRKALAQPEQEPVAWISVKDELPKSVRGVSYKSSLTDTVLVLHSDRPDYPITAHAVVGEGLGAGVAIPTDGASEHPEIAWYSASCNLNNPFNLKNDDYERFLPKIFGSKITHWMPIPATPPQRTEQDSQDWKSPPKEDAPLVKWAKEQTTPPQRTEQEPVAFAGIEIWIGNTRIKKLMTQTELHFAIDPWAIVKFNSDSCIDALKESDYV